MEKRLVDKRPNLAEASRAEAARAPITTRLTLGTTRLTLWTFSGTDTTALCLLPVATTTSLLVCALVFALGGAWLPAACPRPSTTSLSGCLSFRPSQQLVCGRGLMVWTEGTALRRRALWKAGVRACRRWAPPTMLALRASLLVSIWATCLVSSATSPPLRHGTAFHGASTRRLLSREAGAGRLLAQCCPPSALGQVHVLKRAAWLSLDLFCFTALDALGRNDASGIFCSIRTLSILAHLHGISMLHCLRAPGWPRSCHSP